MTFKSYYGSTIREALGKARQELGPDASIVASRQVDPSEKLGGAYEVVCGFPEPQAGTDKAENLRTGPPSGRTFTAKRLQAQQATPAPALPAPPEVKPVTGIAQLKKRVKTFAEVLSGPSPAPAAVEPDTGDLRVSLLADGFSDELVRDILSGVRQQLREAERLGRSLSMDAALDSEIENRLPVDPSMGRDGARRRIVAIVGPPGAGKTSTIVKLAVRYGLMGRRPMRLISMDGARVGGTDALRTYAAGMAVPINVLETGASLLQTLEAYPEAGLILIDTPGLSPADQPMATEMTAVLSRNTEIDVQLAIPATLSPADLRATFARFRAFLPSRLIITQSDNAASCRPAVGLALAQDKAVSFIGTGPRIPEDLEEASAPLLLGAQKRTTGRSAVSAA